MKDNSNIKDKLTNYLDLFIGNSKVNLIQQKAEIVSLIFLKWINDNYKREYLSAMKEYNDEEIAIDPENHLFIIPVGYFWEDIVSKTRDLGAYINRAISEISNLNREIFGDLFDNVQIDFNNKTIYTKKFLTDILGQLENIKLDEDNINPRDLGNIFKNFNDKISIKVKEEAKSFSTPSFLSQLLVKLMDPNYKQKIHDPVVGTGSFLIDAANYIKDLKQGDVERDLFISGQEVQPGIWFICRINLIINGFKDAPIELEDTIKNPKFKNEDGSLEKFDLVLAHPEFSPSIAVDSNDPYNRFTIGTPPKNTADYAFILHINEILSNNGRGAILVSQGVFFRERVEKKIRRWFVEENLIEGVIALADNLFPGAGVPGAILIINKNKSEEENRKIFFIHASNEFEKKGAKNILLEEHINKIVDTYRKRKEIDKFSAFIDLDEIKENDYNLNVSRYIDILPEEEPVDLPKVANELIDLSKEREKLQRKLLDNLRKLKIL